MIAYMHGGMGELSDEDRIDPERAIVLTAMSDERFRASKWLDRCFRFRANVWSVEERTIKDWSLKNRAELGRLFEKLMMDSIEEAHVFYDLADMESRDAHIGIDMVVRAATDGRVSSAVDSIACIDDRVIWD